MSLGVYKKKTRKLKRCKGIDCDQMFSPYTSLQKYCSPQCAPKGKKRTEAVLDGFIVCKGRGCRVEFEPKSKRNKYCCAECRPKYGKKFDIGKKTVDTKWSKVVRAIAGNVCEMDGCNCTDGLSAHHVIARSNHAVRWDLDNGICLCMLHHTFGDGMCAHLNPVEFALWINGKRGYEWWSRLRAAARFPDGMDRDAANRMLTDKLKELRA
jgi:hypothetical protein